MKGNGATPLGEPLAHDAAEDHVSGQAPYLDDLPTLAGTLHAAVGISPIAHGCLRKLDLGKVKAAAGVVLVLRACDVPGKIDIGPVLPGDPVLAENKFEYCGQPVFAVAAATLNQARRAVQLAQLHIDRIPAVLTIEQALREKSFLLEIDNHPRLARNWSAATLDASPQVLAGEMQIGGQEHFYLEGQAAYAIPSEKGGMKVLSSTQHPAEVQHAVAKVLGLSMNAVEVSVRRLGGAFGGKESQATQTACIAALLAHLTSQPVKLRLPRTDDFVITGKRHPFLMRYRVGFDHAGRILALDMTLAADCGMSADLSLAIVNRALFHADNAYHLPCVRITGIPCRTNKASNTAFRGFGGPQGIISMERIIEDIARHLGTDSLTIRKRNLYTGRSQLTPYHQRVSDNILPALVAQLETRAAYHERRTAIANFNRQNDRIKRGLALTPVKFGISFTSQSYNQGGALIHIYHDGSVHLNHGGTEMGQGLFIKVAQVVAAELGIPLAQVHCSATSTGKIPNTSATAASSGSDINGKAAQRAAQSLRNRLVAFAARTNGVERSEVSLTAGQVHINGVATQSFAELAKKAYLARISLSATGYYRTPKIHYNSNTRSGRPFYYFAYGAAVSETAVDILTGEYRLLRVDILHDVGTSINPAIDQGQIEGGFAQGLGWLTCEELVWNSEGRLLSSGPATYKIPTADDIPAIFNVAFWPGRNFEDTIFRSKAVGEPPLMLAISAWAALADAVAAASGGGSLPVHLDPPATPERVLLAIHNRAAPSQ